MNFSFFPKKQKQEKINSNFVLPTEEKCNHKYQDFPPFFLYNWSDNEYSVKIVESYVCPYCKKRIDKILEERKGTSSHAEMDGQEIINNLRKNHPEIKEKFEVEDMINDFILVDREYMHWFHMLHGTQDPSNNEKKEIALKL